MAKLHRVPFIAYLWNSGLAIPTEEDINAKWGKAWGQLWKEAVRITEWEENRCERQWNLGTNEQNVERVRLNLNINTCKINTKGGRNAKYRGTRGKVTDGHTRRERRKEKCEVRQNRTHEAQEESKGMEKTAKLAMEVCSVAEQKEVSFHSGRQMKAADGRRLARTNGGPTLLRLSSICSAGFSTVSSHLDTSVASRPNTAGTLSPGPTRTHTRQTHTVRSAFPPVIHLKRTWGKSSWQQHSDNFQQPQLSRERDKNFSTMSLSSGFLQTANVLMRKNNKATRYLLTVQLNIWHSLWNKEALKWATLYQRGRAGRLAESCTIWLKFTVAAMCRSPTLKLRQPADSHWLDNVSPSLPPSSHPSLLRTISLPLCLAISLASAFTHSLSLPLSLALSLFLQPFHPRVSILHQSAVSRPGLSTKQQHQTRPCSSVCLTVCLSVCLSVCITNSCPALTKDMQMHRQRRCVRLAEKVTSTAREQRQISCTQ